jgi:single-stranded DNA-specific DHH superfamily exonuclease
MHYDIYNGDADGICALHQLRLAEPKPDACLITGVKRDIVLLARPELTEINNESITVLDISLDSNREQLQQLLERKNRVTYIDHHAATPLPEHDCLTTHIVFQADTCTSLIVNDLLNNKYASWAICGAFGDNLHGPAQKLAETLSLGETDLSRLREIGELLNYNGYGATVSDLHFPPQDLYAAVSRYSNPLDFFQDSSELIQLREGYESDMEQALSCREYPNTGKNRVYFLPDAPWARRVAGVFANLKAREKVDAAHALITENDDKSLRISVRAPLNDRRDAMTLCKQFPTGGGRAAAAGINSISSTMLNDFLTAFNTTYS